VTAHETSIPQNDSAGSSIYTDYIKEQVDREDARKESLEKRGLSLITSSGALVTVLFGLAAFVTDSDDFKLPDSANVLLSLALIAFFASGLFAIATNFPMNYEEVEPSELRTAIKERWEDTQRVAERETSFTRIKVLLSARRQNGRKASLLFVSIVAQVAGVGFVAASLWIIL
jgi:hypothetical protein